MSLTMILIILVVLDILSGGAISATLLGLAIGGAVGAGRGALNAVTPAWRRGLHAFKQRWWGALIALAAVGAWKFAAGAAVGAYRGAGPGMKRGHQIRRQGHEWVKAKVAALQTPFEGDTPTEGTEPTTAPRDTAPTPKDGTPIVKPSPPTPAAAPAAPGTPTAPTGASKEDTGMAGENKGARPYVELWKSKRGSTERIHGDLAALREELRSALEANAEHEVGGAQDALDRLTTAIEAVGAAGEAVDAHGGLLDDKWSGAVETLDKVGSESASKLAGAR